MLHGRLTLRRLARTTSLSLLAALSLGVSAAHAAFPGSDGRILYIDSREDLRVIQPDGTGDRIAYSYDGAGSSHAWGQYLPTGAAWSADGRMIAFAGYEFCDANCGLQHQTRVAIVGPDGGIPTTLVQQGVDDNADYPRSPSFSPDGKTVIYSGVDAGGTRRLLTVPVGGGDPHPLPLPAGATDPGDPSFSPDGTRIAFTATETASHLSRVYVATADGAGITRLTSGGNGQRSPAWSADGTRIAYIGAVVDGNAQLAVRPSDGGAADILYSDPRDRGASADGDVSWSPSGSSIVFGTYWADNPDSQCKSELRVIDAGGGGGTSLTCAGSSPIAGADWGPRPQPGDTRVVSRSSQGEREAGDDDATDFALTRGGRYAFYATRATDVLGSADANGASDVFRRDIASGEVALVSGGGDSTADGASDKPLATPAGRFVAFRSTARNLIAGFEGGRSAVYERDMDTGDITLVSRHLGKPKLGTEGDAEPIAMSDDGRYVLFATDATDVLSDQGEQDADRNLFRFDRQTGQTMLVDSTSAPAGEARMSADGRYVAFETTAGDLVAGFDDNNGDAPDLFRGDLVTGDVALVDGAEASATSGAADAPSRLRGFSADGTTVLFATDADDIVPNFSDQNEQAPDLYLRRLADPKTYLVSGFHSRERQGGNGTMLGTAALSADGKTVAWATDADLTGLSAQDNDLPDVFLRRFTPEPQPIELLTTGAKGYGYPSVSSSSLDALSADGRHVLVRSSAQDLSLPVELHGHDVLYRIDWPSHDVTQVTENDGHGPDAELEATAISGDGLTVAYRTNAGNLLDNWLDHNGEARDVFAFVDHRIADVDVTPPDIAIEAPAEGGIYRKGRTYEARYSCRDIGGSGLESCSGDVPAGAGIDTDTVGDKTFTVTATDRAGNATTRTVAYRVALANDHLSLVSGQGTAGNPGDSRDAVLGGDFLAYQSGGKVLRRDLRTGATVTVGDGSDPRISADGRFLAFIAGGKLSVRDVDAGTTRVVHDGPTTGHQLSRDGSTVVYTADGFVYANDAKLAAGERPQVSADGTRVLYLAGDHLYLRDGAATTLVDHAWRKDVPADGAATGGLLSADGRTVLFGSKAANIAVAYHGEGEQLYRSELGGDATLVTSAANDPAEGTGGRIAGARLSGDGATVTWQSLATDVIAGFADHNGVIGEDLYARTGTQPARLVAHGETETDGVETHPTLHAISDDGRFVLYGLWKLDADSEPDDPRGDLRRTDLLRDRVSAVASSPLTALAGIAMNASGRRIAFHTTSTNMVDGFADGNGDDGADVYAWFDTPPVADATARITGPLALAFDGSGSSDADGEIVSYRWDFGDAKGSGEVKPAHVYGDEDSYTVTLTIEDDGSNAVNYEFEVVAIKGVLTAGSQPLDFLGVDKNLRCSAVRGKELFAGGGGECGTFVALGGKVYGPPELVDGVTPYTPVSQDVSQDGDVAKLVTVVALGTTGVQVRQTDRYVAGTAWYRTDVALVGGGDATVYRAGHCVLGHPIDDAGTAMAGCDVAGTRVALLPLTPGAHHEAGPAVPGHLGAGALPDDTIADTNDPAMMIGWRVKRDGGVGSLASFGPDGTIPLTVALKPDKDTVQPLDENAFTVTVRNANGVARDAGPIVADGGGVWDYNPGSTTGVTTADPVAGAWAGPFTIAGHDKGELRFGVTHRNGTRIAITTATAAPAAGVTSAGIADLGEAKAAVDAHPIEGSVPNTAIYEGPTGPTNDPQPRFALVASKESGIRYECRYVPAGWEPCDADYRPSPLADRTYVLEVRAVDAFGADETPAKRTFTVDTVAPNTVIASGPKKVTSSNRAGFVLRAGEDGSRFECRLDGGDWFRCTSPWTTDALADGDHRFEARAIDAAGNADPTPALWAFRVDTTPPVTVIDGVTGRVVRPGGSASASASGSTLAVGNDGTAALAVSCPAGGPACDGTVGLAMEAPKAGIAKVVPRDAVTLARADFTAPPGETVTVRLALRAATRNLVERVGRVAVFPTLDLGTGEPVRGADLVLTPDPRTARLLDAGRELKVVRGAVTLHLYCAKKCAGSVTLAGHTKRFSGRHIKVRMRVTRRGTQSVRITTKPALTKRLSVTLRAKEARR